MSAKVAPDLLASQGVFGKRPDYCSNLRDARAWLDPRCAQDPMQVIIEAPSGSLPGDNLPGSAHGGVAPNWIGLGIVGLLGLGLVFIGTHSLVNA